MQKMYSLKTYLKANVCKVPFTRNIMLQCMYETYIQCTVHTTVYTGMAQQPKTYKYATASPDTVHKKAALLTPTVFCSCFFNRDLGAFCC